MHIAYSTKGLVGHWVFYMEMSLFGTYERFTGKSSPATSMGFTNDVVFNRHRGADWTDSG